MSSSQGWISLSRKVRDCWIWQDKPFSKGQAWVDMLLSANHEDKKFLLGNELVEVKRGSFITSEHKLMDKWGWSKTKVRAFLLLLENDSMIVKISDKKKTTINIVNYSDYQDSQTTKEPQKNHEETTKEPQKDPNNNENNENNVNKDNRAKSNRFVPPTIEEIQSYCLERKNTVDANNFFDFYSSKGWMVGKNKMKDWKAAVRTWERDNKKQQPSTGKVNKFNNFPQRNYSEAQMLSIEQRLLNRGEE